jgi:hypothetical protein
VTQSNAVRRKSACKVRHNFLLISPINYGIGYYDLMNHDEARSAGWDLADVVMGDGGGVMRKD